MAKTIPRFLFYAVNGLGLGHVTRLLAIARKLRVHLPLSEIIFLTSSEAEDVIFREGFAAFKVPSRTMKTKGELRAATYARLVQSVAFNLTASFSPHVLIVDTFPMGAVQELLPLLRWEMKKVFVFREQRPEAATSPGFQSTLSLYDLLISPHTEGEAELPLPPGVNVVYTGAILVRDRAEALPREEARRKLRLPPDFPENGQHTERKTVYVTFGGGGDTEMEAALQTVREAAVLCPDLLFAVAQAPLSRLEIEESDNLIPVSHYPMAERFAAFDFAVSATGYNSAMELLYHGVPTIFVPFLRQVDNQLARAKRIEAAGAGLCLEDLNTKSLLGKLDELALPGTAPRMKRAAQLLVPDNGAERAAISIAGLLG